MSRSFTESVVKHDYWWHYSIRVSSQIDKVLIILDIGSYLIIGLQRLHHQESCSHFGWLIVGCQPFRSGWRVPCPMELIQFPKLWSEVLTLDNLGTKILVHFKEVKVSSPHPLGIHFLHIPIWTVSCRLQLGEPLMPLLNSLFALAHILHKY